MQSSVLKQRRPLAQRGQPPSPPQSSSLSAPSHAPLKHVDAGAGSGVRDGDGQTHSMRCMRSMLSAAGHVPPLRAGDVTARRRVTNGVPGVAAHTAAHVPVQLPHSPRVQLAVADALPEGAAVALMIGPGVTAGVTLAVAAGVTLGRSVPLGVADGNVAFADGAGVMLDDGVLLGDAPDEYVDVLLDVCEGETDGDGVGLAVAVVDGVGEAEGTGAHVCWLTLKMKSVVTLPTSGAHTWGTHVSRLVALSATG
jgi:hypothetical protein